MEPGTLAERQRALEEVAREVRACRACPLHRFRTQAVPGEGAPDARILFVGEGPGYHEDRQGRPFVGNSGRLLEELLARIGLRRSEVFITNVVKCRPPGNRDPLPGEVEACFPFLRRQIEILDPWILVPLGRHAAVRFLGPQIRITRIHGRPHRVEGRLVYPVYHPAAALRRPERMEELIQDFEGLPRLLEAEAARRRGGEGSVQLELFDG